MILVRSASKSGVEDDISVVCPARGRPTMSTAKVASRTFFMVVFLAGKRGDARSIFDRCDRAISPKLETTHLATH